MNGRSSSESQNLAFTISSHKFGSLLFILSEDFACIALEILIAMISSTQTSSDVKLEAIRSFSKMRCSFSRANKAYKAGKTLMPSLQEDELKAEMLSSLSKLTINSSVLVLQQILDAGQKRVGGAVLLKGIGPKTLPQQEYLYDCGLFLLHYVELFLEEAAVSFSPFKIRTFSSSLTVDWFTPSDASFKRALIRKLIYDILNDPSQKVSDNCNSSQFSSGYHANAIDQKPIKFFHNHQCGPSETALKKAVCTVTENGNKINHETSAFATPFAPFDKQERSDMYEFLEKGANSSASPELQVHSFQEDAPLQKPKCATSPKEECADRNDKLVPSSLDKEGCIPVSGIPTIQPFLSSQHYSSEAGEKIEMPLGSVQNNRETGLDLWLKASKIDENGKQASLGMDDGGYVSDSTFSTTGEDGEGGHEDSQQLDADKSDEDKKCENSHEEDKGIEDKTEPEGSEMKCHESSEAEAEVRDTNKDCHKTNCCQGSGMHILKEKESLRYQAIPAGESSFPEVSGLLKRGIESMKIELQYKKRRRVLPSEGGREQK